MRHSRIPLIWCLAGALASCSGGGNSNPPPTQGTPTPSPTGTQTPPPTSAACSLSNRQDWALASITEWYLFPDLLASNVNKASHNTLDSYIDALVAPARNEGKDRFFTYVTSASEEDELINSGATAGFGFRLTFFNDGGNLRVFIIDSFESAPAYGQNIARGDELTGIATPGQAMLMVNTLPANNNSVAQVYNALGPDTAGTTRELRIVDLGGPQRDVTLAKTDFNLEAISPDFGAQVINNNGTQVGYINLRTFISSAGGQELRSAFQTFKNQGITQFVVDLRYNGGGLVSLGNLFGDMLLNDFVGQVFSRTTFRPSKSGENSTRNIINQAQGIGAVKVAFIGSGNSASASELLMNAIPPYLSNNVALIGENTFGKPVGQIGFDDSSGCDDRLRIVAFKTENADNEGEYFNGLADTMPVTCTAFDDIFLQMGDPDEDMTSTALSWLRTNSCTAIADAPKTTQSVRTVRSRQLLQPERPSPAQREVPGLF